MALSKFNKRFIQNCNEQLQYPANNTYCFQELLGVESIIDTMLKVHSSPISWYNPLKAVMSEFTTGEELMTTVKIITGSEHINQYGIPVWDTATGYEISIHNQDRELSEEELSQYGPECIGEIASTRIYDKQNNIIYKPISSPLTKLGFISMNNPDKLPGPSTDTSRMYNQFTPLSALLTTRNSKARANLQGDSFMGTLGVVKNGKAVPISITSSKYSVRTWKDDDSVKTGYSLADCIVIVDIDNGAQINNVMKAFSTMPFKPQLLISEKGVGKTKKGNSTAHFVFDTPLSQKDRATFLKALKTFIAFEHDVYAIDSKATGINFGKNPIQLYKGELTHTVYRLTADNYTQSISVNLMKEWANEVLNAYDYPDGVDIYLSVHKELVSSEFTFTELCLKYADSVDVEPEVATEELWAKHVGLGIRNNTLVYKEVPIYCLQYWLQHGTNIGKADAIAVANNVTQVIWYDINSRYDNSDGAITWKYVYSRVLNCIKGDFNNIYAKDESFYRALHYQYNIVMKTNSCRYIRLQGIEFDSTLIHKPDLPYASDAGWTYTQSQRGGMVQMLRSILYTVVEHREVIKDILATISADYWNFNTDRFKTMSNAEFNARELEKIKISITGITKNYRRKSIMANLILCKAATNANRANIPAHLTVNITDDSNIENEDTSVAGFSILHSSTSISKLLSGVCDSEMFEMIDHIVNEVLTWPEHHKDVLTFNQVTARHCLRFNQRLYSKYNIDTNMVYTVLNTISQGYTNGYSLLNTIRDKFCEELGIELTNQFIRNLGVDSSILETDERLHSADSNFQARVFNIIVNTIKLQIGNNMPSAQTVESIVHNIFYYMESILRAHHLWTDCSFLLADFQSKLKKQIRIALDYIQQHYSLSLSPTAAALNAMNNLTQGVSYDLQIAC